VNGCNLLGLNSNLMLSYDRRSVGQSVLVPGHHLGPATNSSFTSIQNTFRHLRSSSCGVPSLRRGPLCNLLVQLLLGLASAVTLGSKSHTTRDQTLLSRFMLGSLSVASYVTQGYGGGILSRLHTGVWPPEGTPQQMYVFLLLKCQFTIYLTL
jgi:hypothetical protein